MKNYRKSKLQQLDNYFKCENIRYQRRKPDETDEERQLRLASNRNVVNHRKQKSKLSFRYNETTSEHREQHETLEECQVPFANSSECTKKNFPKLKSQQVDNSDTEHVQMKDSSNSQVLNSPNEKTTEKIAYLSAYDKNKFGEIHEQPWAKENVNNFHKSKPMTIHQCTICREAWPIKFKPKRPENYVCSRCAQDKNVPKKFSYENKMIP